MTKNDAISATYRQEFFHVSAKDSRGNPVRCRVNGACKVWKREPERFQLPVKYGFSECFYITESNAADWSVTS